MSVSLRRRKRKAAYNISPHTTTPVTIAASHDHIHRSKVYGPSFVADTGIARRLIWSFCSCEQPLRTNSAVTIRPPNATRRKRLGSSRLTDEPFLRQTTSTSEQPGLLRSSETLLLVTPLSPGRSPVGFGV